jgi:membrane protein
MFVLQERLEKLLFEPPPLPPAAARAVGILRYPYALIRDFIRGELNLRAMSLVYTSLLSIVPLLAFSFSIFKGLGVHRNLKPFIAEFFRPLGEGAQEMTERVIGFVENISSGVLGTLGLAFLLYTVISTIQKIEGSFNFVWRVERPRSFARRVSEYLSLMVVGPIIVVAALGLTASLADAELIERLTRFRIVDNALLTLGRVVPYVAVSLLFAFLYVFIPNTHVRIRPALAGGLLAGVLWVALGAIFTTAIGYATRLSLVYTSFFILITALVWIYIAWLILLLGAQLSYYVQHPECMRRGQHEPRLTASMAEQLALNTMYLIARSFKTGEPGWTLNHLAERLDVPGTLLGPVIRSLEGAGLLALTEKEVLLPGRDIAEIDLDRIVNAARRYHKDEPTAHVRGAPQAQKLAAEIDTALRERLQGRTLRGLVDGE